MSKDAVVIVSGARTPMGGLQGDLKDVSAVYLGSTAIRAAVERSGLQPQEIDAVIMGNVLSASLKQGPARQAAILGGIPDSTGATTVNKLCGSGMQAAIFCHDQLLAGTNKIMLAGGMESMSNAPHLLPGARGGVRTGHAQMFDHMYLDGLEDAYTGKLMGVFAQQTADDNGLTREAMDQFAVQSLTRAQQAIDQRWLEAEIAPVSFHAHKRDIVITEDEQPHKAKLDKIPTLRPAFKKDGGTITAANSSSISDGASALVLMLESTAKARGIKPLARIVAHACNSHQPELFTTAPVGAMKKVLEKANWAVGDVDLWEINEAFAMVTMLAIRDLALDPDRVNVHGGACAQGHPIGSTGSRIIVTLIYALRQYRKQRGIASLCIGGGEGLAMAIELM